MLVTRRVAREGLGIGAGAPLWCAGEVPAGPRVAIVGARAAHRAALERVPALVEAAAEAGFSVVSGGAIGVDAAVHRAALAAGVPQLAVVPSAPERPYPPHHGPLFAAIAAAPGSGVVFTLQPGQGPCKAVFASRNGVVIGLAEAVVVVEAARGSGSFGSGRLALRRRRRVAALLGSPGAAALIADGAAAIDGPLEDPRAWGASLARWLRGGAEAEVEGEAAAAGRRWPEHLRWLAVALVGAGRSGVTVDGLEAGVAGAPESPAGVLLALLEAESLGLVVEAEIGRYRPVGTPAV